VAANRIQYALLDVDGELVKEANFGCPLIASTITELISMAARAHDLTDDVFLEMLKDPDSEYSRYYVVREDAHRVPLTTKNEATLQQLRDED